MAETCIYCARPYCRDGDRFWCGNPDCIGTIGNPRLHHPGGLAGTTAKGLLEIATNVASKSPCAKSKRGVVVFHVDYGVIGTGFNTQPPGFHCDGSATCRDHCNKLCLHAETEALRSAQNSRLSSMACNNLELLHIKVVQKNGTYIRVPGGAPSCWQCSRQILAHGIKRVWLLVAGDTPFLEAYDPISFHRLTLENCNLPVIADDVGNGR